MLEPTKPTDKTMPIKILLAEDSLVNQKVAAGLLKKSGHEVEIAENGREVVDYWKGEPFDLILMDILMPELNGIQATQQIRELESQSETPIPIFAISGNDDEASRKECLQAGMNGFFTKPLKVFEIEASYQNHTSSNGKMEDEESIPLIENQSLSDEKMIDYDTALKNVGGSEEILLSTVELFYIECPKQINELTESLQLNDISRLTRAAHTLKSSFGLLAANSAMQSAKKIEELSRNGNQNKLESAISKLKIESDRVINSLSDMFHLND